jgi:RHS repeat-associated protein
LLSADFRQNFGSGTSANWQVTEPGKSYNIDFSVKIGDGMSSGSAYDENGNILQMQQKGLVLNTSQLIDNLAYTYNKAGISNKLSAVTDNSGSTAVMGDFMDNNTTADDYGYDPNGNLITDMNKRLAGTTGTDLASGGAITYTYQGLPWLINVKKADQTSRGSIKFIYDATGKRLEKRVNEPGATIPNTNTTYLGAFVYVNDVLQYFNQENGKIRPTGNTQQPYAFDYFIKDQLHNTRVILTDEQQSVPFPAATVEQTPAASLTTEQSYYTVNTSNIVRMATIPLFQTATGTNYPNNNGNPPYNNNNNSNTSAQSEYMYRLNGQTGDKTGLGITIKVMTGDKVNLWVKSYYHVDRALDNSFSIANTALANFILAFAATPVIAAGAPHGATGASLQASPVTPPDVHDYLVNNRPTPSGAPKAFLNWILFDEQFRPVSTGTNSGFVAVATTADAVQSFSATATISTSGYLYVYCSNESNEDVYFDNLQAIQVKGPLLEETHYYPFGLTMEGISSRTIKANYTSNKIKLSGQIFDDELDLNTYQMQHRSMDPQIGRFQQIDPVSDKYCFNSTYAYAEDKVTLGTDLEGLELLPSNTGMFRMTAVSKPYYFGLTWEQSVQLVNRNVPSDFKGPDGTPLFSPSSVHIGTQGLMLEGVRGGAQFFFPSDQLPQNPSWPWDQSGADPDPSVSTSGRYLSPNIELSESWTAQAGAIASGRQELESWKNLIQSFPVWQARGDLYDNMYKFDAAIALEATFDKSIAKSYPFAYTPEVKDNLINFIADGTFPNSVDIMSSNFRQNLETNLMTGYFGLQVLQRADPSYIQQSTLDSYNWMVNFYNSLPGIKYNFIPTFLPNNGGFVSDTGSSSSSSMEGVDWEGDYGEFFDGGGYGGYGGGDGGD